MKNIIALIFLALPCLIFAAPPADQGYSLKWSDEFDGASLDTVNNWNYDTTPNYGSSQERYTRSCVTVENGSLVIWSRYDSSTHRYPSGRIDSHDKKIFTYGYFEASIKAPLGQVSGPGLWSCVWLFGNSMWHTVAWPQCGEMQLYEQRPSNSLVQANSPQPVPPAIGDNEFIACCHYGVNGAPSYHCCQYNYPTALSDRFHTYGILWDSLHVEYYFDDTLFWGVNFPIVNNTNFGVPSITLPENFTTFHSPFSWVINVAVGGAYQGQNINNAIFPTKMLVDYVRVYQKSTMVTNTQRKHAISGAALFNSSHTNVKLYDLKGSFVGDFSGLFRLVKYDAGLFVNQIKSNIPQGVYLARISMGRHFVTEKLVIKK